MLQGAFTVTLIRAVLRDVWRYKWLYLLAATVFFSAIAVVYVSHLNRSQIAHLSQLSQTQDKLDIEWRNLLLEEQAYSEHSRITDIAVKSLNMHRPAPQDEVVVHLP